MQNRFISIIHFRMSVIALGFVFGIIVSSFDLIVWGIVIAASVCVSIYFLYPKFKTLGFLLLLFFLLGILRLSVYKEIAIDDISKLAGKYSKFNGWVVSDPELREDKISFIFKPQSAIVNGRLHQVSGRILISVYNENMTRFKVEYGDKFEITSIIKDPLPATNPNSFSYKDYLGRQAIFSTASVSESRNIKTLKKNIVNPITRFAYNTKHAISKSSAKLYSETASPLIEGMALGSYTSISGDTYDIFARTGTLHLLAASGFNCFVIVFYSSLFLSIFRLKPISRSIIVIAMLLIYMLIVGPKPSIVRASIVAALLILAKPLGREADLKNLFFCAVFIVLLVNPMNLFDVGFQLSFLGVGALIFFYQILRGYLFFLLQSKRYIRKRWFTAGLKKISHLAVDTAICCVSVIVFTSPIIAYYFNSFSLTSIPANILMIGFVQLIYGFGILAPLFAKIPLIGAYIGYTGNTITSWCLSSLSWFSKWKYSSISITSPNVAAICIYYIALIIAMHYLAKKYNSSESEE